MDPSDVGARFRWLATALFVTIAVGGTIDLAMDRPTTIWSFHVLFEIGLLAASIGGVAFMWLGWLGAGRRLEQTRRALEARASERDQWRSRAEKLLRGLGEEIDRQLREWELTPVERDTALLLLKGYGHKEIATLQKKSERTVRQHSVSIYRKSSLGGRAQLSAFFLEDLLLPEVDSAADLDSTATAERLGD